MERIRIEYPSQLPVQQIYARAQRLGNYLSRSLGLNVVWTGDTARVQGRYMIVTINAAMKVMPGGVIIEAEDPGFLWRDKAKSLLQEQLAVYLNPQVPIEWLPA